MNIPVTSSLNELLGPSIYLLVLDMFLENPCQWMNLREIARRVEKNPGSISPVIPNLVERGILEDCKVGKVSIVYHLKESSPEVKALQQLKQELNKLHQD